MIVLEKSLCLQVLCEIYMLFMYFLCNDINGSLSIYWRNSNIRPTIARLLRPSLPAEPTQLPDEE